jgi:hypothetical protein
VNPANPIVWTGITQEVCYNLTTNVNPKQLRLYRGDGSSGVYYVRAISTGATLALPTASKRCVNITFSAGLPVATYTLALEDSATKTPRAAARVRTATATVYFARFLRTPASIALTVAWRVDAARHASPRDRVEAVRTRTGKRADWAYTSCACKGPPTPPAAPSGELTLRVPRSGCDPGGYTARLVSGASGEVVAVGFEWIDWERLCRKA